MRYEMACIRSEGLSLSVYGIFFCYLIWSHSGVGVEGKSFPAGNVKVLHALGN